MPVGIGVGVAGIGGALIGASGAKSAAKTEAAAATQAAQLQLQMYNQTRDDLSPYRLFGSQALTPLSRLMGFGAAPAGMAPAGGGHVTIPGATYNGAVGPVVNSQLTGMPNGAAFTQAAQTMEGGKYNTLSAPPPGYESYGGTGTPLGAPAGGALSMDPYVSMALNGPGGVPAGPTIPGVGSINYDKIYADRPDVEAAYQRDGQAMGRQGFADWWLGQKPPEDTYAAPTWTADDLAKAYPTPAPTPEPSINDTLESLPGYKFVREQGLKAVTNSAAARGHGGMDGAYGKGIARFVTGLADSTYADQIARMMNVATMGQNAANQTGAFGSTAASNAGSGLIGAGNAIGAGQATAAGAIGGAVSNLGNAYLTSKVLGMYGK